MITIRTDIILDRRDIRRLERHGYEPLAVEGNAETEDTIIWAREDDLGIPEFALPF